MIKYNNFLFIESGKCVNKLLSRQFTKNKSVYLVKGDFGALITITWSYHLNINDNTVCMILV